MLVVDDDETIRQIIGAGLEAEGFVVRHAKNGREASELMSWQPEAIVLDLMMPDMDGWQFLEQLPSEPQAQPPVVVVSGSYGLGERTRGSGAAAVFSKPFDLMALLETVKHLCDRAGPAPAFAPSG